MRCPRCAKHNMIKSIRQGMSIWKCVRCSYWIPANMVKEKIVGGKTRYRIGSAEWDKDETSEASETTEPSEDDESSKD